MEPSWTPWLSAGAAIVGALLGTSGALLATWLAWKRQLSTRWDERRVLLYSEYLATVTRAQRHWDAFFMTVHRERSSGWKEAEGLPGSEAVSLAMPHIMGFLQEAHRTQELRQELGILATQAVIDAADALWDTFGLVSDWYPESEGTHHDTELVDRFQAEMSEVTPDQVRRHFDAFRKARKDLRAAIRGELGLKFD